MVSKKNSALFLQKAEILASQKEHLLALSERYLPFYNVDFAGSIEEVVEGSKYSLLITPFLEWFPEVFRRIKMPDHIHFTSAGIDLLESIDLDLDNIKITSSLGVNSVSIAEHVIGGILAFAKNFHLYRDQQNRKQWKRYWHTELTDAVLGIIGFGNIGRKVAERAKAFGMRILVCSRNPNNDCNLIDGFYPIESMDEVIRNSDFLLLSVPLNLKTKRLVDLDFLSKMKATSILINVSRGQVVDEDALLSALASKDIGGAVLDVFYEEPLSADHPFWSMESVIVTPHVAGTTQNYMENMFSILSKKLDDL